MKRGSRFHGQVNVRLNRAGVNAARRFIRIPDSPEGQSSNGTSRSANRSGCRAPWVVAVFRSPPQISTRASGPRPLKGAPQRGGKPLNLHGMKGFRRASGAVHTRGKSVSAEHAFHFGTPPGGSPPTGRSRQSRRSQSEPQYPETRANWALRRIPAQSPISILRGGIAFLIRWNDLPRVMFDE
jgi:hypothetical protein